MQKKIILFVHQGAELYGSDKVLLNLATRLSNSSFHAVVIVPSNGPLVAELLKRGIETHIATVTKVSRALFSIKGMLELPINLFRAAREIKAILGGRSVSIVHSNTLAVLSGAVWALANRVPHLWHVHEILLTPRLIKRGYPLLVRLLSQKVVTNSNLTTQWLLDEQPKLMKNTVTIWNGLDRDVQCLDDSVKRLREEVLVGLDNGVIAALVGRINHWKGHLLLVDAATILWQRGYRNIRYLIVGSVFADQIHFLDQLKKAILNSPATDAFVLESFTESIWDVWDACDIGLVPSTEPEPFGMVAIEAMCAGKPIVAAAHGGLLDIVDNEVSGLLFKPNDAEALANSIARLVDDADLRKRMGRCGRARQSELFSLESQVQKMIEVYEEMLPVEITQ